MKNVDMDKLICESILGEKDRLPLLYRMYELGRFARYFTAAGMKAVVTEMSAHIADNTSSSLESSTLSLEIMLEKMKTAKLDRLTKQLVAARLLLPDLEAQQLVSNIEKELKRILFEDNREPESDF